MYNRYQGNTGRFERRTEPSDAPRPAEREAAPPPPEKPPAMQRSPLAPPPGELAAAAPQTERAPHGPETPGLLQGLLGRLSPGRLETGDLMLALLFYLLYRESGDREFLYLAGGMVLL